MARAFTIALAAIYIVCIAALFGYVGILTDQQARSQAGTGMVAQNIGQQLSLYGLGLLGWLFLSIMFLYIYRARILQRAR